MPPFLAPDRNRLGAPACPQGAPLLAGARRGLVLALVLGPLLGSCANNPIARQLAASFDTPPAPTPAMPPAAGSPTGGGTSPAVKGQAGASPAAGIAGAPALVPPSGNAATTSPSPGSPANPDQQGTSTAGPGAKPDAKGKPRAATPTPAPAAAPYRVTLKLPGADPSAPAEVVTRALRAAGVPFEVETIERIGTGSDGSNNNRPAALRATPAPAVR